MIYLNETSQFGKVSDADARALMENMGYQVPTTCIVKEIYTCNDRRFALSEEVVEASDTNLYIRIDELEDGVVIEVDESGREPLVDSINFDDVDYSIEGVYQDDEGGLFACLVSESADDGDGEEESAEEESEEEAEESEEEAEETQTEK